LTAREVELDTEGGYVPPPEPRDEEPSNVVSAARRQSKKEVEGVFLVRDGRAHFRPVRTGITGDMDIELLDGLAEGDAVISRPYQALRTLKEWDRVQIDGNSAGAERPRRTRR
jgi:HlyD family secretion protein